MSYQGVGNVVIASITLDDSVNHASSVAIEQENDS